MDLLRFIGCSNISRARAASGQATNGMPTGHSLPFACVAAAFDIFSVKLLRINFFAEFIVTHFSWLYFVYFYFFFFISVAFFFLRHSVATYLKCCLILLPQCTFWLCA